ncbi:hypothetical protein PMAYCL1PPCAC_13753, partial [Pristionchus mayeri]
VLVTCSSVYLDVLFAPIPAFPALGGYCLGPLCMAGIRAHSVLAGFILILVLTMTAIIACSFYRHQSIIPANNLMRVSKKTRIMIQIALPVFMGVPPIAYGAYPFEKEDIVGQMKESTFKLSWILGRGPYHIHRRTTGILVIVYFIEAVRILRSTSVFDISFEGIFIFSFFANRSPIALSRIRQSLTVLFVQIAVPLLMIIFPAFFLFSSMACECISFDVTLPAYCILTLHPLSHNVILLSATPTYQRFIISTIRKMKPNVCLQLKG